MPISLVLASASPARLTTLRAAGIRPTVLVSNVDEDAVLVAADDGLTDLAPAVVVELLAREKAADVATTHNPDALVLGCDSMLEIDGDVVGKPRDAATAQERWRHMRGRSGVLHTGHCLIDNRSGGTSRGAVAASATTVHFANLSDEEITAYVATGEPLNVAGAFTIDGLGGPFVDRIEGDHHGVVGVSLPLLRRLLGDVEVSIHELWQSS